MTCKVHFLSCPSVANAAAVLKVLGTPATGGKISGNR